MEQLKTFAPILFALIILAYVLPFVNLSYGGGTIVSYTGIQLLTGERYVLTDDQTGPFGARWKDSSIIFFEEGSFAILVLVTATVGIAVGFLKLKLKNLFSMVISILGFVLLYLLKSDFWGYLYFLQHGFVIEPQSGYWLALMLFIASAILQGIIFSQEMTMRKVQPEKN